MSDERPGYYNGLYATRVRISLLKAINEGHGRVYFEANHVWDNALGIKVTNRVLEMIGAEWITAEKVTPTTKRAGEIVGRTYYRISPIGEQVLKGTAMKASLIKFLGWLATTAALLTAYNVVAYLAGLHLPFWGNVLVGFAASLVGVFVGEAVVTHVYVRRMRKVFQRQSERSDG